MSTTTKLDLAAHVRAIEADDPAAQAAAYAEDAVVERLNRDHGPADPVVVRGREAVRVLLDGVASRGLQHTVERAVADGTTGALQVRCRYPDGLEVLCISAFDLAGGRIVHEVATEVWDA